MQAIWPSFFSKKQFLDKMIRVAIFHLNLQRALKEGHQCCVRLPALTKICLSVIPFTAKFTQDWQRQVRPWPARHLCAHIMQPTGQHPKEKKPGAAEQRVSEANTTQTGGLLVKASWSGFILREFFLPARLIKKPSAGAGGYNFLEKQKKGTGKF